MEPRYTRLVKTKKSGVSMEQNSWVLIGLAFPAIVVLLSQPSLKISRLQMGVGVVVTLIVAMIAKEFGTPTIEAYMSLAILAVLPVLFVGRFPDLGQSKWRACLIYVPIVNLLTTLYLMFAAPAAAEAAH